MALPDNTDPAKLGDRILQKQVDQMAQRGELNFTSWGQHSRPASGWNFQAFQGLMQNQTPSTPAFEGSSAPMAWMKLARDDIAGAEGNEAYAYHGSLTSARKAGKFRVTPGDAIGSEEVSVGFGFNLTQPGGRQLYDAALGGKGPSYDDVVNGRKPVSQAEAVSLQEYMILQKNAILERQLGGIPIRDHQRAALVSMLYQGVDTKPVVAAIKAGESDTNVAQIIRNTGSAKFKTRRDHEASRFLGSKAAAFFDNSSNQIPGRG